jgi:hypothetical protein
MVSLFKLKGKKILINTQLKFHVRTKFTTAPDIIRESKLAGKLAAKFARKYPYYLVKKSPYDFAKAFGLKFMDLEEYEIKWFYERHVSYDFARSFALKYVHDSLLNPTRGGAHFSTGFSRDFELAYSRMLKTVEKTEDPYPYTYDHHESGAHQRDHDRDHARDLAKHFTKRYDTASDAPDANDSDKKASDALNAPNANDSDKKASDALNAPNANVSGKKASDALNAPNANVSGKKASDAPDAPDAPNANDFDKK